MYEGDVVHRTQIYLDEHQDVRLRDMARRRGATKSALIRQAVDALLQEGDDEQARLEEFRAAVRATAGIAPYLGEEYERGRAADRERQRLLDERWGRDDERDGEDHDGSGDGSPDGPGARHAPVDVGR